KEAEKLLNTTTPALAKAQAKWEEATRARLDSLRSDWTPLRPTKAVSARGERGATLTVQDDLSVLTSGVNADKDTYVVSVTTSQKEITGIRLEALAHPGFGNKSLSRANGNFVLTGFTVGGGGPGGNASGGADPRGAADLRAAGLPGRVAGGGKGGRGGGGGGSRPPPHRPRRVRLRQADPRRPRHDAHRPHGPRLAV